MKRKGTKSSWLTILLVLLGLGLAVPALCCVGQGGAGPGADVSAHRAERTVVLLVTGMMKSKSGAT
ncbi:MAG: hypothetical protein O7H41_16030 [Planctomycetota bacterium]|nr:hypothetical protein [Planctomycetota bacterium]